VTEVVSPRVVVVGAGPSGLRAAADLAPRVGGEVLVLIDERSRQMQCVEIPHVLARHVANDDAGRHACNRPESM